MLPEQVLDRSELLPELSGVETDNPGVSWEKYVDTRFASFETQLTSRIDALSETVGIRFAALDKAVGLAAAEIRERFATTNEWRQTVTDIQATNVSRREFLAQMETLATQVGTLREWKAEMKGKAEQSTVNIALVIACLGIVISLVKMFI